MASCSLDTYLDGLARQLKDCTITENGIKKHIRWTREHLIWIMCIAAQQIQKDRGDLFLEDKRIKLNVGCYTLTCTQGCDDIRGPIILDGQDCDEKIVVKSSGGDNWGDEYFPVVCGLSTPDGSGYSIDSIEIDPEDPCKIKVNPPVPDDGIQRYITARCKRDILNDIEVNGVLPPGICENLNAFTMLVLSYAYGMDGMVNQDEGQWIEYHRTYERLINASFLRDLSLQDSRILYGQVSANLGE